ncbi:MAG: tetratricopeptide repeat protein [Proteobacteria bacterium]|nr:tetratricopeptide repeat protein [Pseudomonadota bacterium]
MHFKRRSLRFITVQLLAMQATPAAAGGIYTQLVVPFSEQRVVQSRYEKGEHALVLAFEKTSPSELLAFEHYDERLIKRILIKDLGPVGSEVKMILRDRDVRAHVDQFTEPFRVAIDLFDADYEEDHDPTTGMPLVSGKVAMEVDRGEAVPGNTSKAPGPGLKFLTDAKDDTPSQGQTAEATPPSGPGKKHHLLETTPEVFTTPDDLQAGMRSAADGLGKSWQDFPPYIYRLQTAGYEEKNDRERASLLRTPKALNLESVQQMADYAGKLYNFGHEAKALLAYEQVLHKDASLFDRDALHLWKLSEIHLGQGNLTLAQGYFEALTQKHPESPLAHFAQLRLLDIAALRKLNEGNYRSAAGLLPKLVQIPARSGGELAAQMALRQAWWNPEALAKSVNPKDLPLLAPNIHTALMQAYPQVESSRTAFLTASLLLNNMLGPNQPWQRSTGTFAEAYFKRFTGAPAEPYRSQLKDLLLKRLTDSLQAKVSAGKLLEATADYEALPTSLRSIKKDAKTAWAIAEAYRKLGQRAKAIDFYHAIITPETEGPDRFKAQFWLAVTAGEEAEDLRLNKGDAAKVSALAERSRVADKEAGETWKRLKEVERQKLGIAYKEPFENTINSPAKLRTGLTIVLANWTKALSTKASTKNGGDDADWSRNFSPSGSAVILLSDLAKRFALLGMTTERRQALSLLKFMTPKDLGDDKAAKQTWAADLINLAEDYRKANQYLDAGRLFNLVGAEAENFEGRAEALYKGGLLLYRAGRRAEAVEALKKAEADGNNLFYANLAKERLSQLQ